MLYLNTSFNAAALTPFTILSEFVMDLVLRSAKLIIFSQTAKCFFHYLGKLKKKMKFRKE
jgi:hypothetical protein